MKTPDRIISAKPTLSTNNIGKIPSPDLILLCVKSYDLDQAVTAIKTVAHEITVIISLLNGVNIVERIRAILDKGIVLPTCLYLGTHIEIPGVINQSGGNGIIICGPNRKHLEYSNDSVKDYFQKNGIKFEWRDDPLPKIREKYMFIAAFGLVTALYGEALGTVMKNAQHHNVVKGILEEILAKSC